MSKDDDIDNDRTESVGDSGERPDRPRIERLGHFKIEATLGSGGMGTIYRAYDDSMKRPIALKVLHSSLEISERAQSRFVREAWIAGQLDHPNIIKVHSRGEENNVSYLAMTEMTIQPLTLCYCININGLYLPLAYRQKCLKSVSHFRCQNRILWFNVLI